MWVLASPAFWGEGRGRACKGLGAEEKGLLTCQGSAPAESGRREREKRKGGKKEIRPTAPTRETCRARQRGPTLPTPRPHPGQLWLPSAPEQARGEGAPEGRVSSRSQHIPRYRPDLARGFSGAPSPRALPSPRSSRLGQGPSIRLLSDREGLAGQLSAAQAPCGTRERIPAWRSNCTVQR